MRFLCALFLTLPALAQIESVKFHYGDDLRWAAPDFDDSRWIDGNTPVRINAALQHTWQWARYKVRMPARSLDPVIGAAIPTVEVFVEGRRIGGSGQLPPLLRDAPSRHSAWAIPADLQQPGRLITVALRIWRYPGYDLRRLTYLNLAPPLFLHNAVETPLYEDRQRTVLRGREWGIVITSLLILFLFLSGPAQWSKAEFQILAGYLCAHLASMVVYVFGSYFDFSNTSFAFIGMLYPFAYSLQLELLARFAGVRPGWWLRTVQALNVGFYLPIGWAVLLIEAPSWLPVLGPGWQWIRLLNLAAALAVLLLQRPQRVSERLLPLGLALVFLGSTGSNKAVVIADVTFNASILGNILFGGMLVAVHLYRLRQSSAVAARLQGQFAAARGVQEMLLSGNIQQTPHYSIDPVYRPADEVGGDFFRILSAPGDATLVIIGDVSGKGLRAAMLVSLIVGVLLHRRSSDPAAVLAELNGVLAGQLDGGFVTCCAALLHPNGEVHLANAGHPSPYGKDGEIDVPAGLPLGILPNTHYDSSFLHLEAGDCLTFISDGVIEAANSSNELFGFDRVNQLSASPAADIAEAAKTWGQNDDITVVTVRRPA